RHAAGSSLIARLQDFQMVSFVPDENIGDGPHREFTAARAATAQPGLFAQLSKEAEIRSSNKLEFGGQILEPLSPEWRGAHPIVLLEARERNRNAARKAKLGLRKDAFAIAEMPHNLLDRPLARAMSFIPGG